MAEVWANIPDYPRYQVSTLGNVKKIETGQNVETEHLFDSGYLYVWLHKPCTSSLYMVHRLVAATFLPNPDELSQVDHINGVKSDNRVENLRMVTAQENQPRRGARADLTSRYRGVSWAAHVQKWNAQIMIDYKQLHLGYYEDEVYAARVYDAEARALHGDSAQLNFPNDQPVPRFKPRVPSSKFRGVSLFARAGKYHARIQVAGKQHHLGSFDTEEQAARAYNRAALDYYGAHAKLNDV